MNDFTPASFEEALPLIDGELNKRRSKWTLQAVNDIDFDDVSQIIRIHIYNKFGQYDKSQPFTHWINRIISNQTKNLLRNKYYAFERPCLRCPCNVGDNTCSITPSQKQCAECVMFGKWLKRKKSAHDVKLAVSIESHLQEVFDQPSDFVDIEAQINKLSERLREILRPVEWKVYTLLYIEHKSDNDVARIMKYTTNEKNKNPGYRRITCIRQNILTAAKKILKHGLE